MKITCRIAIVLMLVYFVEPKLLTKKEKRGIAVLGATSYDSFRVPSTLYTGTSLPVNFDLSPFVTIPDIPLTQVQIEATHNVAAQALKNMISGMTNIVYPPDVVMTIQKAKEANENVYSIQYKVEEAKQAAISQQKFTLAKQALARDALKKSQEISSAAEAEARMSAQHLIALQQRLASLKDSAAAAQRVAAAREAAAAVAIQRIAAETAAQLQKQDVEKQIYQSEREAKEKGIIAEKESAVANSVQHIALQKLYSRQWNGPKHFY